MPGPVGRKNLMFVPPALELSPSMPYNPIMSAAIAYTSVYVKRVEKVLRTEERDAMELHVAENPEIHPVIAPAGFERHGGAAKGRENAAGFE